MTNTNNTTGTELDPKNKNGWEIFEDFRDASKIMTVRLSELQQIAHGIENELIFVDSSYLFEALESLMNKIEGLYHQLDNPSMPIEVKDSKIESDVHNLICCSKMALRIQDTPDDCEGLQMPFCVLRSISERIAEQAAAIEPIISPLVINRDSPSLVEGLEAANNKLGQVECSIDVLKIVSPGKLISEYEEFADLSYSCIHDLEGLFKAIKKDAKEYSISYELAKIGAYLVSDWANLIDCNREDLQEKRLALGLKLGKVPLSTQEQQS